MLLPDGDDMASTVYRLYGHEKEIKTFFKNFASLTKYL